MLSSSKLKTNLFVAQTLASSVKTLLGPNHSVKCCVSEDESVICSNAAKLLQFIDVEHPAGFVINDACQGLHKIYGKSCKTLVCLIGFWSRAAEDLLDKGVPVSIIVRLFQEALDHCLSVLGSVAIPLDVRKFYVNETTNTSSSTVVLENSDGLQRVFTKHSITDDLNLSCAINKSATVPEGFDTLSVGTIAYGDEGNFGSHLETHSSKFGQSGNYGIPNVSNEVELDLAEVEVESFKNDEDVSWFFDPHNGSDPINRFEECCQQHSKSTIHRPGCTTLRQSRNGSFLEDDILKKQFNKKTKRFACWNNLDSGFSNEQKSDFAAACNSASKGEFVTRQQSWEKCDSYSTIFSMPKQKRGKAESTLQLQNVELRERLATLLQEKEKRTKPRIDSLSKYSRSISVDELLQSTQIDSSSDAESVSFLVDVDNPKKNCEPTDNSSDDEFSSCFDDVPIPTAIAFKAASVSLSKAPKGNTRKIKVNSERNDIESNCKKLQKNASRSGTVNLLKYSRVALEKKKEDRVKVKMPSVTSILRQTRSDIVNASRLTPTQGVVRHHLADQTPIDTVNSWQALGKRMSHGRDKEMDLAVQVVQAQINYAGKTSSFETNVETNSIYVETIIGPPTFESRVVDGLTIEVDAIDMSFLKKNLDKPLSFVLVNGDITPQFRHLGFKEAMPITQVLRTEDDLKKAKSDSQMWFERVEKILNKFKIDVVIVKGVVDDTLANYCMTMGVLVLQKVTHSKLQLLSTSFRVSLATYLRDIRTSEVGGPITVDFLKSGWTPLKCRRSSSKLISTTVRQTSFVILRNVFIREKSVSSKSLPLQTALITGPSRDIVCDSEMNFWGCVYSLKNAISCKKVLPGAGISERACIQELERLKQQVQVTKNPLIKLWTSSALNEFRPVVYSAFIYGFELYLMSVLSNSGQFPSSSHALTYLRERLKETGGQTLPNMDWRPLSHVPQFGARNCLWNGSFTEGKLEDSLNCPFAKEMIPKKEVHHSSAIVWDDFLSKCEAWRRAVGVVLILLQSDALITTGVDRT